MSYHLTVLTTTRKCNMLSINELGLMQVSCICPWMENQYTECPQSKDASESILVRLRASPQIRKSCISQESCTIGQGQESRGKLPDSGVRSSEERHGPETSKNAHRIMQPLSGILCSAVSIRLHDSCLRIHGPRSTSRQNPLSFRAGSIWLDRSMPAPRHGWAAVFSQRVRM